VPRATASIRLQLERAAWELERSPQALGRVRAAADTLMALAPLPTDRYRADALTALGLTLLESGRACESVEALRAGVAARGGVQATSAPGWGLETRCALRLAEEACGRPVDGGELRACAADLPRWGIADRGLLARLAAR
jgi:hypothetical protein